MREGVSPSCVVTPSQGGGLLIDFLAGRLPVVEREEWLQRMERGEVMDEHASPVTPVRPFVPGLRIYYYRELASEAVIPFEEAVLYQDEHLVVADKPHFLPVVPTGRYLQHTLLVRLKRRLGLDELSPVHRIDRDTAGLVLFSVQRATRGRYQALFRDRAVDKTYEAVAPWRVDVAFPGSGPAGSRKARSSSACTRCRARRTASPAWRCWTWTAPGPATACPR